MAEAAEGRRQQGRPASARPPRKPKQPRAGGEEAPPAEAPAAEAPQEAPVLESGPAMSVPPGVDPSDVSGKPKSKAAIKNEKKKAAKAKAEATQEVDKVAQLAALMGMGAPQPAAAPLDLAAPPAAAAPKRARAPASAPAAEAPAANGHGETNGGEEEKQPNEVEKKVRALRKKLRAIDDLASKRDEGSELNADQLAKVAARGELVAEIERWEALNNADELSKEVKKLGKKLRQIEELGERATPSHHTKGPLPAPKRSTLTLRPPLPQASAPPRGRSSMRSSWRRWRPRRRSRPSWRRCRSSRTSCDAARPRGAPARTRPCAARRCEARGERM